jgi:hypothetical protein
MSSASTGSVDRGKLASVSLFVATLSSPVELTLEITALEVEFIFFSLLEFYFPGNWDAGSPARAESATTIRDPFNTES